MLFFLNIQTLSIITVLKGMKRTSNIMVYLKKKKSFYKKILVFSEMGTGASLWLDCTLQTE